MTALTPPSSDAPAAEWGCFAVSIPGWRWMPGMLGCHHGWTTRVVERKRTGGVRSSGGGDVGPDCWPDPDDPATAGCLLRLYSDSPGWYWVELDREHYGYRMCRWMGRAHEVTRGPLARNPGRAVIAAAAALGRWPGGEG